jgi:hypothetical protein
MVAPTSFYHFPDARHPYPLQYIPGDSGLVHYIMMTSITYSVDAECCDSCDWFVQVFSKMCGSTGVERVHASLIECRKTLGEVCLSTKPGRWGSDNPFMDRCIEAVSNSQIDIPTMPRRVRMSSSSPPCSFHLNGTADLCEKHLQHLNYSTKRGSELPLV